MKKFFILLISLLLLVSCELSDEAIFPKEEKDVVSAVLDMMVNGVERYEELYTYSYSFMAVSPYRSFVYTLLIDENGSYIEAKYELVYETTSESHDYIITLDYKEGVMTVSDNGVVLDEDDEGYSEIVSLIASGSFSAYAISYSYSTVVTVISGENAGYVVEYDFKFLFQNTFSIKILVNYDEVGVFTAKAISNEDGLTFNSIVVNDVDVTDQYKELFENKLNGEDEDSSDSTSRALGSDSPSSGLALRVFK